jgi:ribosomal protein L9
MGKYKALRNINLGDGRSNPGVKKDSVFECDDSFAKENLLPKGLAEVADKKEVVTAPAEMEELDEAEETEEKSGKGKGKKGK